MSKAAGSSPGVQPRVPGQTYSGLVARLVLLNGLPGCGKSTLARRYADDHPLTLVLDIDVVRGQLGAWLDQPTEAGRLARVMSLEMARAHLRGGHEVLVPQFLARCEFARALAGLAGDLDVPFVEVALLLPPAQAARRFADRTAQARLQQDRHAALLLERQGGLAGLADLHQQLLRVVRQRPGTVVLDAGGPPESTYRALLGALSAPARPGDRRGVPGGPAGRA